MGAFAAEVHQAEVHQNEYLPPGGTQVHAVITVTATGRPAEGAERAGSGITGRPDLAEVILLDCSGSMANPAEKIDEARRATREAIACLPDGVWFAVVRGTGAATSRVTDRVGLRIWTPRGARVRFLREVAPTLRDLTADGTPVDDRRVDYPTGAWGTESRDYHLSVQVPGHAVGTEALAARVSLVVDGRVSPPALVRAVWTADEAQWSRISAPVAHHTGQQELAAAVLRGLEARRAGDESTATLLLGRSAQLALTSGNEETYRLLQKVVHIDNPTTGTVRLKKNVKKIDEMVLDTRSTRTLRVNR